MKNSVKQNYRVLLAVFILLLAGACENPFYPQKKFVFNYQIGDTGPGGGKIFYRSANGFSVEGVICHYLEAVAVDINRSVTWSSTDAGVTGTVLTIGAGKQNTKLISEVFPLDSDTNNAAKVCIGHGSPNDWFLPSYLELNELFRNHDAAGITMGSSRCYWSSSQNSIDASSAYFIDSNGSLGATGKVTTYYFVWPIRAF